MVTLRDVAQAAGVSVATASHVLCGKGTMRRVASATQQRVLDAARALNYQPNRAARSLRGQDNRPVFALLLSDVLTQSNISGIVRGIQDYKLAHDHPFEFGVYTFHASEMETLPRRIQGLNVNGILLGTPDGDNARRIQRECPSLPLVLLNRYVPGCHCVYINARRIGEQAAELFWQKGYRHVAIMDMKGSAGPVSSRCAGFQSRCEAHGMSARTCLISGEDLAESVYAAALSLAEAPPRPQAVFFGRETFALVALQAFAHRRVAVPEDVELLVYSPCGEIDLARYARPPLSAAYMPCREMVKRGMEILLEAYAAGSAAGYACVEYVPEFQFRESFTPAKGVAPS